MNYSHIETYQSYQAKAIFESCNYIVCFLGLENSKAKFIGVYRVTGQGSSKDFLLPADFPYPEMLETDHFHYDLELVPGFDDLVDRVVIDWGSLALAWHSGCRKKK